MLLALKRRPVAGMLVMLLWLAACAPPPTAGLPASPVPAAVSPAAATRPPAAATVTPAPAGRSARLSEPVNVVEYRPVEAEAWQAAVAGSELRETGGARTGPEARVRLDLSEGTILRLAGDTEFRLAAFSPAPTDPITRLFLDAGRLWVQVTKALGGGAFEVETPAGSATVRGSLLGVAYFPAAQTWVVTCLEGECRATPAGGAEQVVPPGQQLTVTAGGAPQLTPLTNDELAGWRDFMPEAAPALAALPTPASAQFAAPGLGGTLPPGTPGPTRTPGSGGSAADNFAPYVGAWSGPVTGSGLSAALTLTVPAACAIGGSCGAFQYSAGSQCAGDFVLVGVDAIALVLAPVNEQNCPAFGRYFLQPNPDGSLTLSDGRGLAGRLAK